VRLARKDALNASVLVLGRVVMMASGIITVGVSARYLGPSGYGAFAIALAFVSLLGSIIDLGFSTIGAREIAKRPKETRRIVASIFTVSMLVATLAVLAGLVGMNFIFGGADDRLVRNGIAILLLTLFTAAASSPAGAYFTSSQQAYIPMIASLLGMAAGLASLLLATALDWGFTGVVSSYVAAWGVQTVVVVGLLLRRVPLSLSFDTSLWGQLVRWSLPVAGLALINSLYARLDIVLLSFLRSDADAGIYSVAFKVVDGLVLLPPYVMITLLPAIARLDQHSEQLADLTQKALAALEVGAVAVLVLFVGFAEEVIEIVGGRGFERAAPALQILMIGVAAGFANAVFGNALVALNQQGRMFKLALVGLAVNLALNLTLIPLWGINGAAIALSATEVILLALIMRLYTSVGSLPRVHRGPQVALAGAAMAAVVLAKLPVADSVNPVIVIVSLGSASVVVYVMCLYALRAMPAEVHAGIVLPLLSRLKPR
jgi:O-antigen/teichoic acid export membrane protein